ncbi:hypothetical protein HNR39_000856 [Glaciimonas immobilis]|uniref:Uncharacterized protein n=1 Tax=Glaciimonas immobilis TaxID=728004 RepID=A0A840RPW3_9BURK|nr:hypothetical protein [Glaciimonas immobilis]
MGPFLMVNNFTRIISHVGISSVASVLLALRNDFKTICAKDELALHHLTCIAEKKKARITLRSRAKTKP